MKAADLFTKPVVSITPWVSVRAVAELMRHRRVGAVVVTQQDVPIGIVTDRDIATAVCRDGFTPDEPVERLMTAPVETVGHTAEVSDVVRRMIDLGVRRLPVVDGEERLIGLVSFDDLILPIGQALARLAGTGRTTGSANARPESAASIP